MARVLIRVVIALLLTAFAVYLGDYAWLRWHLARGVAFDTVQVQVVYAIPEKGNKAEFAPQDPQDEACVRSLFPHLGSSPCWYLRRHTHQQVNF